MPDILLILRSAPFVSSHPVEAIEVALVASALGREVAVLFSGAGVWQLVRDQSGIALGMRAPGDQIADLPDYDIDMIHVCADSLHAAGLTADELVLPVQVIDRRAQQQLIAGSRVVLND